MKQSVDAEIYQKLALGEAKRLVSLLDREPFSPSSGCFDRAYWSWKFNDFPGARFQEGVYALAHLYARPFPGNEFAGMAAVLEWVRAGFRFWSQIQYEDGSFVEAYPNERSLAATAFTAFFLSEAFLLVRDELPPAELASLKVTFLRAADWLTKNEETHGVLTNHLAAAAASLHLIGKIFEEPRFLARSRYFLERIYAHQSPEGWYEEYGGADPGYQCHATFYLARLWQHSGDAALLESLRRSLAFEKYFIHPNRTLGGEYASRNTEFYLPAGFEILAHELPDAALIAGFMRESVANQEAVGLAMMDAHNFFPLLNNYLFAAAQAAALPATEAKLPCESVEAAYFPDAGLYVKSNQHYYAVLGLAKGGTLKVYAKRDRRLLHSDAGYYARTSAQKIFSQQSLTRHGRWSVVGERVQVSAPFYAASRRLPDPWTFFGFRGFMLTFGKFPLLARWVKRLLVAVLVSERRSAPLALAREVEFGEREISLADEITLTGDTIVTELATHPKFTTIHMGSSRYFQRQELAEVPALSRAGEDAGESAAELANQLMAESRLRVQRVITIDRGLQVGTWADSRATLPRS